MNAERRRNAWGVAVAALYVIAAMISLRSTGSPARILYDGLAPLAPYRWVHAPPALARENQPPEPGTGDVPFGPEGLSPLSVTSGDGEAAVIFSNKTVAPRAGEAAVRVTIIPLDPATVAPPPTGLRFDSNAYRIDSSFIPSGAPIRLGAVATVVLRYATGANEVVRFSGSGWTPLASKRYDAPQLLTADTQDLGIFATLAPANLPFTTFGHWWLYGAFVLLALIAILAISFARRNVGRGRLRLRRSSPALTNSRAWGHFGHRPHALFEFPSAVTSGRR